MMRALPPLVLASLLACGGTTAPQTREVQPTVKILDTLEHAVRHMPPRARWRTVDTDSFRVLYLADKDIRAAREVARAAEAAREAQFLAWLPGEPVRPWLPRCDIHLYPSRHIMVQMGGGQAKAGSALARPSKLLRGRVIARRIDLSSDDPGLLHSTLPHEVSHVIVAELMGSQTVPLWVNEGLAMLTEAPRSRRRHRLVFMANLRRGRLYPLEALMSMKTYPDFRRLFYGQSLSLVEFLLTRGDNAQLLSFVHEGVNDRTLRKYYGFTGYEGLRQAWLRWLRTGSR